MSRRTLAAQAGATSALLFVAFLYLWGRWIANEAWITAEQGEPLSLAMRLQIKGSNFLANYLVFIAPVLVYAGSRLAIRLFGERRH